MLKPHLLCTVIRYRVYFRPIFVLLAMSSILAPLMIQNWRLTLIRKHEKINFSKIKISKASKDK